MSKHLGDYDTSTVVYGKFTTYQPSTGATFLLGGTPALSVYKDNSTTQSTSGITLTANFDSVTGLNHFAIDTSSDGTFYSAGSFFDIVITTGTVDGVSVTGSVVASFTLRKDSALKPATAGRTLLVDSSGLVTLVSAYDPAKTAAQAGDVMKVSSGTGANQISLSSGTVTVGTNSDKTGYALTAAYDAAKTAAQVSDIPTANENADALLKRDWTAITGEAARSVLNALRRLRNRVTAPSTTLSIYKEDGSSIAWTATLVSDPAADNITSQTP